jgi:AAA domain
MDIRNFYKKPAPSKKHSKSSPVSLLSEEQEQAVALAESNNLVINSVAGSGKTTVLLEICKRYPHQKNLLLTYNKRLQKETNEKIKKQNITNVEAYTIHAFCASVYGIPCNNDEGLKKIIEQELQPKLKKKYDRIIGDEFQDQTPLLFRIFCRIIDELKNPPLITIVGDNKQCIYKYDGADERFLTMGCPLLRRFNEYEWREVFLTQSFRISYEMAKFLSSWYPEENEFIKSTKHLGRKPIYCIGNLYFAAQIADILKTQKNEHAIDYHDTFVLAKTIRNGMTESKEGKSPVCKLENYLKANLNLKINVSIDEEKISNVKCSSKKLEMSSYHATKGLEALQTMIFSFDSSFFEYYAKDLNPKFPPNEIYVAGSRATEHMFFMHHVDKDMLSFLQPEQIVELCDVVFLQNEFTSLCERFKYNANRFKHNLKYNHYYDSRVGIDEKDSDNVFREKIEEILNQEMNENPAYLKKYGAINFRLILILRRFQENKALTLFNFYGRNILNYANNKPVYAKKYAEEMKKNNRNISFEAFKREFENFTKQININDEEKYPYRYYSRLKTQKIDKPFLQMSATATSFLRNLNIDFEKVKTKITYTTLNSKDDDICIPCEIRGEQVSDINGIVIPAIYQYLYKREFNIFDHDVVTYISSVLEENKKRNLEFCEFAKDKMSVIQQKLKKMETLTNEEFIFSATCYWTKQQKYHFKILQLQTFDWISEDDKQKCLNRVQDLHLSDNIEFEKGVATCFKNDKGEKCKLTGFIDCYDSDTDIIWEFKCVQEVTKTHKAQLLVYMYLFGCQEEKQNEDIVTGRLYNIRSNELIEMKCTYQNLTEIMVYICQTKLNSNPDEINDDLEFLEYFKHF